MSGLPPAARGRLLELLVDLSFARRPVTLSSGKASDFYVDSKQTILTAEGHWLVGHLFSDLLDAEFADVEAVGGLTLGADPLASAVSTVSWLRGRPRHAFYVRKEPKTHGTAQWLEGTRSLRPAMPVAILEDVITTGASAEKAAERARAHGLDVRCILALVDRQEENGRENLERLAPVRSLFLRADFFA